MAELGKATQAELKAISAAFQVYGDFVSGCPYGSGHINDTYQLSYSVGGAKMHYLLQRINHHVFTQPQAVQQNILRVTSHIAEKLRARLGERVLGPVTPPVTRIQTLLIKKIVLKVEISAGIAPLREVLERVHAEMRAYEAFKRLLVHYDVDPV